MSNRYWISVGAIALSAALAGVWLARIMSAPAIPALEIGTVMPQPRVTDTTKLISTRGAGNGGEALRGHPTLVFFGFTHCPDVCPTTLALLAGVQKKARVPGLSVALITVDPQRDTPDQLALYVASFGAEFIGLTGSAPDIVAAQKSFGVAASRVELAGDNYTMDHSATVFVLDARARIVAVFTPPLDSAALTRDLEKLAPALATGTAS